MKKVFWDVVYPLGTYAFGAFLGYKIGKSLGKLEAYGECNAIASKALLEVAVHANNLDEAEA